MQCTRVSFSLILTFCFLNDLHPLNVTNEFIQSPANNCLILLTCAASLTPFALSWNVKLVIWLVKILDSFSLLSQLQWEAAKFIGVLPGVTRVKPGAVRFVPYCLPYHKDVGGVNVVKCNNIINNCFSLFVKTFFFASRGEASSERTESFTKRLARQHSACDQWPHSLWL